MKKHLIFIPKISEDEMAVLSDTLKSFGASNALKHLYQYSLTTPDTAKHTQVIKTNDPNDIFDMENDDRRIWIHAAHGDGTLTMLQSILALESKGAFKTPGFVHYHDVKNIGNVFYLSYAQYLLRKKGIKCSISFDSEYGFNDEFRYFAFPNFSGIDYVLLQNDLWKSISPKAFFGCDCKICTGIENLKNSFLDEVAYKNILRAHNFIMMEKYIETFGRFFSMNVVGVFSNLSNTVQKQMENMRTGFDNLGRKGMDDLQATKFSHFKSGSGSFDSYYSEGE